MLREARTCARKIAKSTTTTVTEVTETISFVRSDRVWIKLARSSPSGSSEASTSRTGVSSALVAKAWNSMPTKPPVNAAVPITTAEYGVTPWKETR